MNNDTRNVFFNRNYRLVFFGALVSELGAILYSFAVSFYILEITDNNAFLQGLYLALCGGMLLLATPVGGVLGDRFNKAKIMFLCDYMNKVLSLLKKEPMLAVSLLAAAVALVITPPTKRLLADIDWRTLGTLLMMLCVLEGFKRENVLRPLVSLASSLKRMTLLSLFLIFGVFFSSMFVTNDVSLIIFVPVTIQLFRAGGKERYLLPVITMENIAAVRGSLLTPFGSPQNLFLYSRSGVSAGRFMLHMLPLAAMSAALLIVFVLILYRKAPREEIGAGNALPPWKHEGRTRRIVYLALFLFCRGDGPVGAGGDHLAQGRVANVPCGEDAWDGGLHKLVRHDEAALIELDLALYQLRPRKDAHGHEQAADVQRPLLLRELVLHDDGREPVLAHQVRHGGIQHQLHVLSPFHPVHQGSRRPELIPAVDQIDLAADAGEVQSVGYGGVAAAHDANILAPVEIAVAGGAVADARTHEPILLRVAQLPGPCAHAEDHGVGGVLFAVDGEGLFLFR